MHVAICHQELSASAGPDERDVLEQVEAVAGSLKQLGHSTRLIPCSLDLGAVKRSLQAGPTDLVFNLVESLDDHGSLLHCVPALLEALRLPYTGASAQVLVDTSHKPRAKAALCAAGLPTPGPFPSAPGRALTGRFIVKSVWEHASRGLDQDSVVQAQDVARTLAERERRFGGAFFAEAYIAGRELNVALLARGATPEVLPIAEITFHDFPDDMPKIVDYAAKWLPDSPQYRSTLRRFADSTDATEQPALMTELERLSLACWHQLGLRGYARVDFRVSCEGQPYILEVNANPCLSPDAGFQAALQRAGVSFQDAVARIVDDALASPRLPSPAPTSRA